MLAEPALAYRGVLAPLSDAALAPGVTVGPLALGEAVIGGAVLAADPGPAVGVADGTLAGAARLPLAAGAMELATDAGATIAGGLAWRAESPAVVTPGSSGTISRATMLMILISGLIAGPAVSL